jgi:hypothetical protein
MGGAKRDEAEEGCRDCMCIRARDDVAAKPPDLDDSITKQQAKKTKCERPKCPPPRSLALDGKASPGKPQKEDDRPNNGSESCREQ